MPLQTKIESRVKQTLSKIKLNKKKRIIIALSGGKDSTTVAYILHKLGYNISGVHIDLGLGGYSERCLNAVKKLCNQLGIGLHIYNVRKEMGNSMCYLRSMVQTSQKGKGLKNCAICGVLKKWILNKVVRKLRADKIATGHNLDDECQTFLVNIFKGSPELSANTGIETRNIPDKKFIPRIKPLFYVDEKDVRKYTKALKLPVVYEKCPCALDSYRIQVRKFVDGLSEKDKLNIMKNFEGVIGGVEKAGGGIVYCGKCGEPSRGKICKACELVGS